MGVLEGETGQDTLLALDSYQGLGGETVEQGTEGQVFPCLAFIQDQYWS